MSLARLGAALLRTPVQQQRQWLALAAARLASSDASKTADSTSKPTGEVGYAQQRLDRSLPPPFDAFKPYKHWVSYGWCENDIERDRTFMHFLFFTYCTLFFWVMSFFFYYCPHSNLSDWAMREAFIRVAEREANGLPYIDKDLVPMDRIVLPSDQELGDTEIII